MKLEWRRNLKGRGRHNYYLMRDGWCRMVKISHKDGLWRIKVYCTTEPAYYHPERFGYKDEAMAVAVALARLT